MKLTESKIIEGDFFEDLVKWSAEQGFVQAQMDKFKKDIANFKENFKKH